jgi:hypothetical protein
MQTLNGVCKTNGPRTSEEICAPAAYQSVQTKFRDLDLSIRLCGIQAVVHAEVGPLNARKTEETYY